MIIVVIILIYERHVILPKGIAEKVPRDRLLSEYEWRALGIVMSRGWIHYAHHQPEPHIMLFRRPYQGETPRVQLERKLKEMEKNQQQEQLRQKMQSNSNQKFAPPKPIF